MSDDAPRDVPPIPLRTTCPQCHNPHTIVAEQRYRDVMRFCPMCDHSWVVGQVSREADVQNKMQNKKGRRKAGQGDDENRE